MIIKNLHVSNFLYLKDTRRHFIEQTTDIYLHHESEEEQIIYVDFKAAWRIDTESLREISEKFNVDFKIYAFETGAEFNQDIEIIKGKIIKDEEIKFTDYVWECIDPYIGG